MMIELDTEWQVNHHDHPRFTLPCDTSIRDRIIERYATLKGGVFFNGDIVCIDRISPEERRIELTSGSFFDLVLCNVIGRKYAEDPESLRPLLTDDGTTESALKAVAKLKRCCLAIICLMIIRLTIAHPTIVQLVTVQPKRITPERP